MLAEAKKKAASGGVEKKKKKKGIVPNIAPGGGAAPVVVAAAGVDLPNPLPPPASASSAVLGPGAFPVPGIATSTVPVPGGMDDDSSDSYEPVSEIDAESFRDDGIGDDDDGDAGATGPSRRRMMPLRQVSESDLSVAWSVDDPQNALRDLPRAQELLPAVNERNNPGGALVVPWKWKVGGVCFVTVLVGAIVTLAILLSASSIINDAEAMDAGGGGVTDDDSIRNSGGQSQTDSVFDQVLPGLPEVSYQRIMEDPNSAQARAFEWLAKDPNLMSYEDYRKVQRYALATLYISTGGPEGLWTWYGGWMDHDTHECKWLNYAALPPLQQKPCHEDDGHMNALVVDRNEDIRGTLPSELGLLSRLQALAINTISPHLTGTIPPAIWHIPTLRVLTLVFNGLTGTLSSEMFEKTKDKLLVLDLAGNSFTGTIPTEIGFTSKLTFLGLSEQGRRAGQTGLIGTMPSEVGYLTDLNTFTLGFGNLRGSLPTQLGQLRMMEELQIHFNHLVGTLPTEIGMMTKLKIFQTEVNNLSGTIPEGIWRLSTMEQFNFGDNYFESSVPEDIGISMPNIIGFKMQNTAMTGSLPSSMALWSNLEELAIDRNPYLSGTVPFQEETQQWTQLKHFFSYDSAVPGPYPKELCCNTAVSGQRHVTGTCPEGNECGCGCTRWWQKDHCGQNYCG